MNCDVTRNDPPQTIEGDRSIVSQIWLALELLIILWALFVLGLCALWVYPEVKEILRHHGLLLAAR